MEKKTLSKPSLDDVLWVTTAITNVYPEDIVGTGGNHRVSEAKVVCAHIAHRLGYTQSAIARYMGRDVSTISEKLNNPLPDNIIEDIDKGEKMLRDNGLQYLALKVASHPENPYYKEELKNELQNEN